MVDQRIKYGHITAKPYCADLACIQAVMNRHGCNGYSQEDLGFEMGLVVPIEDYQRFRKVHISGKSPSSGYGTRIHLKDYSPNKFFKAHGIPIRAQFYPLKSIADLSEFVVVRHELDMDIIAIYDKGVFDGSEETKGHAALIEGVTYEQVAIIDPAKGGFKRRKIKLEILLDAVKAREEHGGGFWLFRKI